MAFGLSDFSAAREKVSLTFALTALCALYLLWSSTLAANLKPWVEAGRTMNILRRQIEEASFAGPTVLLDLPLQIKGVPCIIDASQISTMLQPPFTGVNLSKMAAIVTAKDIDFDHAEKGQPRLGQVLAFLGNELVPAKINEQEGPNSFSLNFRSPSDLDHIAADNDLVIEDATKWHATSSKNKIQFNEQFGRLTNAGNKPLTIWLPWKISSAQTMLGKNLWTLKIDDGGSSNPQFEIVVRHLNDDGDANAPADPGTESKVVAPGDKEADLTALPGYLLSLQPRQLGLRIPPQTSITLAELKLGSK